MMVPATKKEERMIELLTELLDCGYADLEILLDSNYDFYDILSYAKDYTEKPTLNDLIYSMLQLGIRDVESYINEHYKEVRESLSDTDFEEFNKLEFNPFEDIEIFVNSIDSHAYFINDMREHYEKYFPEAIDHFEKMTGLTLE